jgi:HSP20 family molecular chaperone IbpA
MTLPPGADPDAIEATTANGVLEVTIPVPKEKPKKVEIKAASNGAAKNGG